MSCLLEDDKIYLGDVGTAIILDTKEVLDPGWTFFIEAARPGSLNMSAAWGGTLFESTKVRYVLVSGDIDVAGEWRLQAKVVTPEGSWHGGTVKMKVYKRFQ